MLQICLLSPELELYNNNYLSPISSALFQFHNFLLWSQYFLPHNYILMLFSFLQLLTFNIQTVKLIL